MLFLRVFCSMKPLLFIRSYWESLRAGTSPTEKKYWSC